VYQVIQTDKCSFCLGHQIAKFSNI